MSEEIRIEYKRPPFYRRVFANLIDIILVALCFFSFFIGIRSIVTSNSSYKEKVSVINKTKKECGLFIEYQGHYVDVVTYLNAQKDFSSSKKIKEITSSIDNFLEYSKANLNLEDYEEIKNDYYTSLTSSDISSAFSSFVSSERIVSSAFEISGISITSSEGISFCSLEVSVVSKRVESSVSSLEEADTL